MNDVRSRARIIVGTAVDGTPKRRGKGKGKRAHLDHHVKVDERVMEAAKAAMLPGQRLVIVSATEVRLVNS